ncbi:hypothetical protein DRQ16_04625 [bacterium]|nr:MAG: hypothetical protein DRQ16_04625 [bacterium]
MRVFDVLQATGGKGVDIYLDEKVNGFSVDSRTIKPGEMFFALKGERFDGHDFVEEAQLRSGKPACVERKGFKNVILVPDTLKALGDLAGYYRRTSGFEVIAITGSCGKTTTKALTGSIIKRRFGVYVAERNYNNLVGVPLSILRVKERYAVLELAINMPGEMERLSWISKPNVVVITAVGPSHLEGLGTIERVKREKLKILSHAAPECLLVYNQDSLGDVAWRKKIGVSLEGKGDINGEWRGERIKIKGREYPLPVPSRAMAMDVLLSVVVGLEYGIPEEEIEKGILEAPLPPMRMEIKKEKGKTFILDMYNANPLSMKEALDFLSGFSGRRIAVLGDMLELGRDEEVFHREIGKYTMGKADVLLTCGKRARRIYEEFEGEKYHFDKIEECASFLRKFLREGDVVLLKASRKMEFERIAEEICSTTSIH